ncbi:MSCRAMM family protein [Ammoniphilus resinae]|uniref:5-hydroxyisourate hydrolase-like protein (Transthyretin family) n=1 Tax=Ammoniphilus resinae TaxID=861532 RepID=A0ABS4GLA6_9BACL|nr:carboxypeptidase-like regulatory domain-containing protein [Ammoniphilus resinae]MBP1930927.1 5-hydroxyisourate hydrolase-like protein (transthyretin family) [Ammoniphilus resinae]
MAITDIYQLQSSPSITVNGHEEEVTNIHLEGIPQRETGVINGAVQFPDGKPAAGVVVQIIDANNQVIEHNITNPAGKFEFTNVPLGPYSLVAGGSGYLTSERMPVTVSKRPITGISITILPNHKIDNNVIYGTIQNSAHEPVANVTVELIRRENATNTIVAVTKSNQLGNFLFGDLDDGVYFIRAAKLGFLVVDSSSVGIAGKEFVPINVNLPVNPTENTGTVSGMISDKSSGHPIPGATVALFRINNGTEKMIDITRTNNHGYYLFGSVEAGTYIVRATVQVSNP